MVYLNYSSPIPLIDLILLFFQIFAVIYCNFPYPDFTLLQFLNNIISKYFFTAANKLTKLKDSVDIFNSGVSIVLPLWSFYIGQTKRSLKFELTVYKGIC